MIHATLSQFPDLHHIAIEKFAFIKSEEELIGILDRAIAKSAIVVTTLVNPDFNKVGSAYAQEKIHSVYRLYVRVD